MIESYKEFLELIQSFKEKPKLLLHCCCAPCSTHVLFLLREYFDITVFFSNDNIYPKEEYDTRLAELKKFMVDSELNFKVLDLGYHPEAYYSCVKGLEHLGERSERCYACYKLRLKKTAEVAVTYNFDYFTTTLSISPYKNDKWLNEIGYQYEREYGVSYLYSNFKKQQGYLNSIELSKKYQLYRQDYCGCIYSLNERRLELERSKEENKDS